jgi:hypothetical protein
MDMSGGCTFYDFVMEDAQLDREVSKVFYYYSYYHDEDYWRWLKYAYEGNTNQKWVYDGTITAHISLAPWDTVYDTHFNVDGNGRLIEDENIVRSGDTRNESDRFEIRTEEDGSQFFVFPRVSYFLLSYSENAEIIKLSWVRQLPEILNCDYYIADEIDEDTDTRKNTQADTQKDTQSDTQEDTQKDTQTDTETEQKKVENTKEPTVDITAEDVQLYTIGKPLVWDGTTSEDGLSPNVYDDVITGEEPLTFSKFVHDKDGVIYGEVKDGVYLYIPAVYLSETPVETYVEYEPIGEVWFTWDGDGKATTVTSSSHLYEDPNLNDGELVEVPLSDFTSVGETLYAKETCTYNGVKYKVLYFNKIRYLIDAWEDAE